jgi:glycosyltransferase involved in cell wall biosynthesis
LFASGDSETSARLVPGAPRALRLAGRMEDEAQFHADMLRQVYAQRRQFDVLHFHLDGWHLREPRLGDLPHLTTVHGRVDLPERRELLLSQPPSLPLVSISAAQRAPLRQAAWIGTVHHGLPMGAHAARFEHGDYLVFLGRMSPEKRPDRAIEIAGRFGMRLKIAAKIDEHDRAHFQALRSQLERPWVDFVGEVDEARKTELLSGAYALLFPIDWPEPFGLAMIEAMSCGTPVVAWRRGAAPEIVDEGQSGFTVDSVEEALRALERVAKLDRRRVAKLARQRFGAQRMALDYLRLYARSLERQTSPTARVGSAGTPHAGSRE